jgi:biopolymer transport protein ExbD
MINIKGQKDYLVALESVAMTDIVLNMFIFFFISFSLLYTFSPMRISKLDVKLPKATTATALEGSEKVMLTITKDGEFFIDDEKLTQEDLKQNLHEKLKKNPGLALLMKVDGLTRFESLAKALDIINELNIQRVSVAAVKE